LPIDVLSCLDQFGTQPTLRLVGFGHTHLLVPIALSHLDVSVEEIRGFGLEDLAAAVLVHGFCEAAPEK
jgi:hypothetical protein